MEKTILDGRQEAQQVRHLYRIRHAEDAYRPRTESRQLRTYIVPSDAFGRGDMKASEYTLVSPSAQVPSRYRCSTPFVDSMVGLPEKYCTVAHPSASHGSRSSLDIFMLSIKLRRPRCFSRTSLAAAALSPSAIGAFVVAVWSCQLCARVLDTSPTHALHTWLDSKDGIGGGREVIVDFKNQVKNGSPHVRLNMCVYQGVSDSYPVQQHA